MSLKSTTNTVLNAWKNLPANLKQTNPDVIMNILKSIIPGGIGLNVINKRRQYIKKSIEPLKRRKVKEYKYLERIK